MRPGIDLGHQSQPELGGAPASRPPTHVLATPELRGRRSPGGKIDAGRISPRSNLQGCRHRHREGQRLLTQGKRHPNAQESKTDTSVSSRVPVAVCARSPVLRQLSVGECQETFAEHRQDDEAATREDREVAQGGVREGRMPLARARRADAQQRSRQAIDEPASPVMIVDQLRRLHRRSRLRSASAARLRGHWAHRSGDAGLQEHGRGGIGLAEWYRDFS